MEYRKWVRLPFCNKENKQLKDDPNRSLTLALPYIVAAIEEKTLYVFGACNILSIPIGTSLLSATVIKAIPLTVT